MAAGPRTPPSTHSSCFVAPALTGPEPVEVGSVQVLASSLASCNPCTPSRRHTGQLRLPSPAAGCAHGPNRERERGRKGRRGRETKGEGEEEETEGEGEE
eukprot:3217989-Rhodomonas_salina.3